MSPTPALTYGLSNKALCVPPYVANLVVAVHICNDYIFKP